MIDEDRFYLGALCKRGHRHEGEPQSLRYLKTPVCVTCAIDHRRAADAAKRRVRAEAMPPPPPIGQKKCAACKNIFPESEFKSNGIGKCRCNDCAKQYYKEYYVRKPEIAARMAERSRSENPARRI